MKKLINIAKLLHNSPRGTKLWSPMFGDVVLENANIDDDEEFPITISFIDKKGSKKYARFTATGQWYPRALQGDVVLWPNKNHRTWEGYKCIIFRGPKHQFKPFDRVLVARKRLSDDEEVWVPALYAFWDVNLNKHVTTDGVVVSDDMILPYVGNYGLAGSSVSATIIPDLPF